MKTLDEVLALLEKIKSIVTEFDKKLNIEIAVDEFSEYMPEEHYEGENYIGVVRRCKFIDFLHGHWDFNFSAWKKEFTTPEICKRVVLLFGENALAYIPKKFRTPELLALC